MASLNNYAGFGRRLIASIIDFVAIGVVTSALDVTVGFLLGTAYFVWMTGAYGATIGKMIVHIKVVKEDGGKVDYGTALIREISTYLSFFVLMLGYFNVLWDKKKQGWHDKIAKTLVVVS